MAAEKAITLEEYSSATLGLVARKHSHISINGLVLFTIFNSGDDALTGLKQALNYLAGRDAEMELHYQVLLHFLSLIWNPPARGFELKREAATGATLTAFLRYRGAQSVDWLRRLLAACRLRSPLRAYILGWAGTLSPSTRVTVARTADIRRSASPPQPGASLG